MVYTAAEFDSFATPEPAPIGTVRVRDRVALAGTVTDLAVQQWVGPTPALHATITDPTGSIMVAFLGRTDVPGITIGAAVTVAGAVIRHWGRPLIMNPLVWLVRSPDISDELAKERTLVHA